MGLPRGLGSKSEGPRFKLLVTISLGGDGGGAGSSGPWQVAAIPNN